MKKNLKLVSTTALPAHPAPPRKIGPHGTALWVAIHSEYEIADAGGVELLAQACAALDMAERCRAQIDADGLTIRTKAGLKDHPCLKHELANRAFVTRAIGRLGLDVEALKPVGRPPGV